MAFGTYIKRLGGKRVSISGDIRLTTPRLIEYFSQAYNKGQDLKLYFPAMAALQIGYEYE